MPKGGLALKGMLTHSKKITPILHLYVCNTSENQNIPYITPNELKSKHGVIDAVYSQEWWALKTPKLKHIIIEIYDAKFKAAIDNEGNAGLIVKELDYEVIKDLPHNAPELFLKRKKLAGYETRTIFVALAEMLGGRDGKQNKKCNSANK